MRISHFFAGLLLSIACIAPAQSQVTHHVAIVAPSDATVPIYFPSTIAQEINGLLGSSTQVTTMQAFPSEATSFSAIILLGNPPQPSHIAGTKVLSVGMRASSGYAHIHALPAWSLSAKAFAQAFHLQQLAVIGQSEPLATNIPVHSSNSIADLLAQPPVQATGVVFLGELPPRALLDSLHSLRIPTFGIRGSADLAQGLLSSVLPDAEQAYYQRSAREIAMQTQRLLLGLPASPMPASPHGHPALAFNMPAISQTGLLPELTALEGGLLFRPNQPDSTLGFHQAIALGLNHSWSARMAQRTTEIKALDLRMAKAKLLPEVGLAVRSLTLSDNLVDASLGQKGKVTAWLETSLSQVLFSEPALAQLSIRKMLVAQAQLAADDQALGTVLDIAQAYFNTLIAHQHHKVQQRNLQRTLRYLELATQRQVLGDATLSDINRWNTALQMERMATDQAHAAWQEASWALQTQLGLEALPALPVQISIDTLFPQLQALDTYFAHPLSGRQLTDSLLQLAYSRHPSLQQLAYAQQSQDRMLTSLRRSRYLPTVALGFTANDVFVRSGLTPLQGLPVPPPPDALTWSLGVHASWKISQGGARKHAAAQAQLQLEQLSDQRQQAEAGLAIAVGQGVARAGASFRAIALAKEALQTAERQLAIVEGAYLTGGASVTALLDAQQAHVQAAYMATTTHYAFALQYLLLERLSGQYSF